MNWRVIVGLALLLLGIKVLYTALAAPAGTNMTGGKIGSGIWIAVGLYLLVKGMTRDEPKL